MQSHPTQTQALASNPLFELGNHSWAHPDFAHLSPDEMQAEILRTQDLMYKLTGQQPRLFRFPYDSYTEEAIAVVGQLGLLAVQEDVVTGDADLRLSPAELQNAVATGAWNGSIVIMHMNRRGWHTAEALPDIIGHLRTSGYTLVTVSQLLGLRPLPGEDFATDTPHPARLDELHELEHIAAAGGRIHAGREHRATPGRPDRCQPPWRKNCRNGRFRA